MSSKSDMGSSPENHPRDSQIEKARRELLALLRDWRRYYDLTPSEELALLAEAMTPTIWGCVRAERGTD